MTLVLALLVLTPTRALTAIYPSGCYIYDNEEWYFNAHATGGADEYSRFVCKTGKGWLARVLCEDLD